MIVVETSEQLFEALALIQRNLRLLDEGLKDPSLTKKQVIELVRGLQELRREMVKVTEKIRELMLVPAVNRAAKLPRSESE